MLISGLRVFPRLTRQPRSPASGSDHRSSHRVGTAFHSKEQDREDRSCRRALTGNFRLTLTRARLIGTEGTDGGSAEGEQEMTGSLPDPGLHALEARPRIFFARLGEIGMLVGMALLFLPSRRR